MGTHGVLVVRKRNLGAVCSARGFATASKGCGRRLRGDHDAERCEIVIGFDANVRHDWFSGACISLYNMYVSPPEYSTGEQKKEKEKMVCGVNGLGGWKRMCRMLPCRENSLCFLYAIVNQVVCE